MVNDLSSNVTRKVVRVFLDAFESARVLTKTVNTQLLSGEFDPQSGSTVDFKRPHQYRVVRTPDGDVSGETENSITSGKATGTVQPYFTADIPYTDFERALELDQFEDIIAPAATQIVTDLEVDFGRYMVQNAGLINGTYGTNIANWSDVAGSKALMSSIGVNKSRPWYHVMNPYSDVALADQQATTIAPGGGDLVPSAWESARISRPLAGMQALMSDALATITTGSNADQAGTLAATPTGTYAAAKDTMTQQLSLTGLSLTATLTAGQVIVFDDADTYSRLNISTRQAIVDSGGNPIPWSCVITEDAVTDGSGDVTVTVASAAINETDGQYNNIKTALQSGAAFTIQGVAAATVQPGLFYQEQAFGIGTVKLFKLNTWDTVFTTEDGFSIRMTKYSDGKTNSNNVRFDLLPAYATFNPNAAGQAWGA